MRSLSYILGIKFKLWRCWLRFLGNRTFIQKDNQDKIVGVVYINGSPSELGVLLGRNILGNEIWTEEKHYPFKPDVTAD